jgi:hypothetical protein
MARLLRYVVVASALATSVAGCSLIVDVGDLSRGDAEVGDVDGDVPPSDAADTDADADADGDADADVDADADADGCCGVWARRAGGTSDESAYGLAALSDGSSILTGYINNPATFGAGELGETTLTPTSEASTMFVAKYDPLGALVWARMTRGGSGTPGEGIAALADGSAVVIGQFDGTATWGWGEPAQTVLGPADLGDVFVAKYGPSAMLAWAKAAGGAGRDSAQAVDVLPGGGVLVVGSYAGPATFGAGETGETVLSSTTTWDWYSVFAARYEEPGSLGWARTIAEVRGDYGYGIAVLAYSVSAMADGSFLVCGNFRGSATFGPGDLAETVLDSAGGSSTLGYDIFVAKYDSMARLVWAKRAGGPASDAAASIQVLPDGSSLVVGQFAGTAVFGAGEVGETSLTAAGTSDLADVFVARYGPDGALEWAKRAGGTVFDSAVGVGVLADGSMVVAGSFQGFAVFGPGEAGETTVGPADNADLFVAHYDSTGAFVSVQRTESLPGGTGPWGSGGAAFPHALRVLDDEHVLVSGTFQAQVRFFAGQPEETVLEATGSSDIFVARFRP